MDSLDMLYSTLKQSSEFLHKQNISNGMDIKDVFIQTGLLQRNESMNNNYNQKKHIF